MKIRRFVAKDMRTALAQIKEELGAEAVIMSNKRIPEGVELMAAIDYGQKAVAQTEEIASTENRHERDVADDVVSLSSATSAATKPTKRPPVAMSNSIQETATYTQKNEQPVDSLDALLRRRAQLQDEGYLKQQQLNKNKSAAAPETAKNKMPSIEEQFKNFTERLQQSNVVDESDNLSVRKQKFIAAQSLHEENNEEYLDEEYIDIDLDVSNLSSQQLAEEPLRQSNKANLHTSSTMQNDLHRMEQEMLSIRQLLEHQLSGLMWQDMAQKNPKKALLINRLVGLGLSEQVAEQIASYVPSDLTENEAWHTALDLMAQQINTTNNDIVQGGGGVVSLVGPTGVGKTTTIAKLAARFAQVHGADQVALISTDTYRIAGYEQLETYARIIGCQVRLAKDAETLDGILQQFSKKKLILIDTAGMGQRDLRLAEHLATLVSNTRVRIRNYLVLSANTQHNIMQENVDRFNKIPLYGCIYTKLDESLTIGEMISISIQNGLPIGYLTDGQRVPEDIKVANAVKLVSLAEKRAKKLEYLAEKRASSSITKRTFISRPMPTPVG